MWRSTMKSKKILIPLGIIIVLIIIVVAWFSIGREKVVLIRVANLLLHNRRYNEAITALKINTRIYPQSAGAHSALARAYYYAGNRSECFWALEMHEREFERRERFVYTVMNLDETECLGCIYIRPSRLDDFDAEVVMWVSQDAFDRGLDEAVLKALKD
jgi:hypothetical protein